MKFKTFFQALLLAAPLAVASQARADLVRVEFNTTIDESPFVTPGYTVGDDITGWFAYDPASVVDPGNSGANHTSYPISEIHILLGGSVYKTGSSIPPASVMLWHAVNETDVSGLGKTHSSAPVDLYDLRGIIFPGPGLEGASPYYAHLVLTDLDAAFYTSAPPYPIDLPPPGVFEFQTLKVNFLGGEPFSRDVWANIDSFTVIAPTPDSGTVPENGNSFGFLGLSVGLLWLHRKFILRSSRCTA